LVIVFFFRFSVSAYYITLYVYMVELYPARSRAMGNGIASAIGTLGSTLSPLLLGVLDRNSIDMNILFCSCAVIGVGMVSFMPETLGL
jgi:MFS family permease